MKEQAETLRENVEHWHKQYVRANARAEAAEEQLRLANEDRKFLEREVKFHKQRIADLERKVATEARYAESLKG